MRSTLSCRFVLTLSVLASCGCAGFGLSRGPTDLLIEPDAAYRLDYVISWSKNLQVPNRREITSVELLDDMLVLVEQPGNYVTALSVSNGSLLWKKVIGTARQHLFRPVRLGDRIFINSETELVTLKADTGDIRFIAQLDQVVASGPTLINDVAVFGGINGVVFGHDVNASRARWSYQLSARITTPPVAIGLNAFAADTAGAYAMLLAANGKLLWPGRTFGPVTVAPAVDRVGIYVACEDLAMYALNRTTGKDLWQYRATQPLTAAPTSIGLTLYQPLPGSGLVAIDSVDGRERWQLDVSAQPVSVHDDRLLLATATSLLRVDVETGSLIDEAPTLPIRTVLNGPDDSVILVSARGRLLRLNPTR